MTYNSFVKWAELNEKEFEKDLTHLNIQKIIITTYIIFMLILLFLILSDKIKTLPSWMSVVFLILIIGVPYITSLFDRKLKFNEFISILLFKISNEIETRPKQKKRLFSHLQLLNKNFRKRKFSDINDITLHEKVYAKILKFEENILALSRRLHHASFNDRLKEINIYDLRLLADSVYNQEESMYSKITQMLSKYKDELEFPKKLDFFKSVKISKNRWVRLFLCEILIASITYLFWWFFSLEKDTAIIVFATITAAVIYIVFK